MVAEWVEHSAYNRDSKSVIVPLRALLFQNEFSPLPLISHALVLSRVNCTLAE